MRCDKGCDMRCDKRYDARGEKWHGKKCDKSNLLMWKLP